MHNRGLTNMLRDIIGFFKVLFYIIVIASVVVLWFTLPTLIELWLIVAELKAIATTLGTI